MSLDRIRLASLHDKVISAEEASAFIEDGMTVGMSGFTRAGEAKAVPLALVKRAHTNPLKITLITGASLGNDLDKQLTEAGVLARRLPFQVDNTLRKAINNGEVMFIDQHLSETVEQMRNLQLKKPDVAIIEAVAITEDGGIIPTTSVGNSASFAIFIKDTKLIKIPITKESRKFPFTLFQTDFMPSFLNVFINEKLTRLIDAISSSYIPEMKAIVPPDTPGTASAAPMAIPFKDIIR